MYLRRISIKNFRVFGEQGIDVEFNKGVNAIIGENNTGKSAVIDAIRIALSAVPYRRDIYFTRTDFHVNHMGVAATEAQFDLFFEDVPNYLLDIWDPECPTQGELHIRFYLSTTPSGAEKVKYEAWGGKTEGNKLSPETFDAINVAYLGALRDAEGEMRPSRSSKLANLFGAVASDEQSQNALVDVLLSANQDILAQEPVKRTKEIINSNLLDIEKDLLRQQIDIGLVDPRFDSIRASLKTWIVQRWLFFDSAHPVYDDLLRLSKEVEGQGMFKLGQDGLYADVHAVLQNIHELGQSVREELVRQLPNSFELHQNGLGYNNLLFMSTVLGDMSYERSEILFNLFLIEEPEAHLHPQLQGLVHGFFEKKHQNSSTIQVIYTSHSPTLVSRIGLDAVNLLYVQDFSIKSYPLTKARLSQQEAEYLERFLDVTKSQMFFSKGIVFVEGISEALLVPEMAKLLGRPLDQYAVELVNVDGISFKPFVQILNTPNGENFAQACVITDDDRCSDKEDPSTYINKELDFDDDVEDVLERLEHGVPSQRYMTLDELCQGIGITVHGAAKTLEYELALEPNNIPYLLNIIKDQFPKVGPELERLVNSDTSNKHRALRIWLFMRARDKSKAQVSQALSHIIKKQVDDVQNGCIIDKPFAVPGYIKEAIYAVTGGSGNEGAN